MPTLQIYGPPPGPAAPRPVGPPPLPLISPLVRQSLGYDKSAQIHDSLGLLVLTLAFSVLTLGWVDYFMPGAITGIVEMGAGGGALANSHADESSDMEVEAPPEAVPENLPQPEDVQPPQATPEVADTPEPVQVVDAPDAVTVPPPPEIVNALRVINPKRQPQRVTAPAPVSSKPKPAVSSARSAGPVAAPGGTGAGGSGGGSGAGQGRGKSLKSRTPRPNYPSWARSAGITGTTIFKLVVDTTGRITSGTVIKSCGNARLDNETLGFITRNWSLGANAGSTVTQPWTYRIRTR
ncbi:MAG: hypothetical protein JWM59_1975 [Verrucomicrobiales bacterium]|nr:hypothetical protein [Verrucomicrobiales bacterium]